MRAPGVAAFVSSLRLSDLYVSVVTVSEIRHGIAKAEDRRFRSELSHWLEDRVLPMFDSRVLPLDEAVLMRWLALVDVGRQTNRTFPQPDLFIAATALVHDLTVLTRDVSDFDHTGTRVLDPWSADPAG